MRRALLCACLALGACGDPAVQPQHQTGPVEVLRVDRIKCTLRSGQTDSCQTDLLLKAPNNVVWVLHLEASYSQPPVWASEHTNIVYIQVPGDERMRVLYATELR